MGLGFLLFTRVVEIPSSDTEFHNFLVDLPIRAFVLDHVATARQPCDSQNAVRETCVRDRCVL